jgi:hypothetical protein
MILRSSYLDRRSNTPKKNHARQFITSLFHHQHQPLPLVRPPAAPSFLWWHDATLVCSSVPNWEGIRAIVTKKPKHTIPMYLMQSQCCVFLSEACTTKSQDSNTHHVTLPRLDYLKRVLRRTIMSCSNTFFCSTLEI